MTQITITPELKKAVGALLEKIRQHEDYKDLDGNRLDDDCAFEIATGAIAALTEPAAVTEAIERHWYGVTISDVME